MCMLTEEEVQTVIKKRHLLEQKYCSLRHSDLYSNPNCFGENKEGRGLQRQNHCNSSM